MNFTMDFRPPQLSETGMDEIAEQLFDQVLDKYTAGQRIPTVIELARTVSEKVGIAGALKCVHWMEEVYRQELIEMKYSLPTDYK